MANATDVRHLRLLAPLRAIAKQVLVRRDVRRCRRDPDLRTWLPVLEGSRAGHVVVPSKAVATSRAECENFVRRGLVGPGDAVLDVGAGNGRQAIGLLELGVGRYRGLDVVRASVQDANRAFAAYESVGFDFLDVANHMYNPHGTVQPELVTFPYADESFDFAVAGSLYTHLERLEVASRYVAETARVLRSGGTAYMSWFRSPPNPVTDSATRTVFTEADIRRVVEEFFVIVDEAGGETTSWHDQWQLYLRRR